MQILRASLCKARQFNNFVVVLFWFYKRGYKAQYCWRVAKLEFIVVPDEHNTYTWFSDIPLWHRTQMFYNKRFRK